MRIALFIAACCIGCCEAPKPAPDSRTPNPKLHSFKVPINGSLISYGLRTDRLSVWIGLPEELNVDWYVSDMIAYRKSDVAKTHPFSMYPDHNCDVWFHLGHENLHRNMTEEELDIEVVFDAIVSPRHRFAWESDVSKYADKLKIAYDPNYWPPANDSAWKNERWRHVCFRRAKDSPADAYIPENTPLPF